MSGQVIVFEGPDRTGKSTIADVIAKHYGTEVFMTNSRQCFLSDDQLIDNSSNLAEFNLSLVKYLSSMKRSGQLKKNVVIYRSFMSERVYSDLLDRKTSECCNRICDWILRRMDATIILCDNKVEKNFKDDILDDDQVLLSKQLYQEQIPLTMTDILQIDTTDHDIEKYAIDIIEYIDNKGGDSI